jgi:predicted dehydrogenase
MAVAARDRGRAEAFAEAHGVERAVDSYDDLIHDPEIDVVSNSLPNGLHQARLRAGRRAFRSAGRR